MRPGFRRVRTVKLPKARPGEVALRRAIAQFDAHVQRCEPGPPPRVVPGELRAFAPPLAEALERAVDATTGPLWDRLCAEGLHRPEWGTGYGSLGDFLELWLDDRSRASARHRSIARRSGLRVLGSGNRRVALAISEDLAVKVALHDEGRDANRVEATVWSEASEESARWLMPTLAADRRGSWTVQPRSEGKSVSRERDLPSDLVLVDPSGSYNWGLFCGRSVLLDYE